MAKFFKIFQVLSLGMVLLLTSFSLPVSAAGECGDDKLSISNLFTLNKNIPVIPKECSEKDGQPVPLSPALIGVVLIRVYAFLVSLAFTIVTPSLIAIGLLYIGSGFGDSQKMSTLAKTWASNLGIALILLIFAYIIPLTINRLLRNNASTELSQFFTS